MGVNLEKSLENQRNHARQQHADHPLQHRQIRADGREGFLQRGLQVRPGNQFVLRFGDDANHGLGMFRRNPGGLELVHQAQGVESHCGHEASVVASVWTVNVNRIGDPARKRRGAFDRQPGRRHFPGGNTGSGLRFPAKAYSDTPQASLLSG